MLLNAISLSIYMLDVAIFGLGNPGLEYKETRHNLGFIILDYISSLNNLLWQHKKKLYSDISEYNIESKKVAFIKPMTFMNNSGICVQSVLNYYKLNASKVIVIYDDMDLPFCKMRCKIAGGSGGHNGIKSIDQAIGVEYLRMRVGIGRPENNFINSSDYVLHKFSKNELQHVKNISKLISDQISCFSEFNLLALQQLANYINNTNLINEKK